MSTKTLPTLLICGAVLITAVVGWQISEEFFSGDESALAPDQVLVKALPSANRDVKRDRIDAAGAEPSLRLSLADGSTRDLRAEFSPTPMPPPMIPRPMGKNENPARAYLNDTQLAALKQRLRLTKAQEVYWTPLEAALRDLTQQIADYQNRVKRSRDDSFDLESAEIQRLKATAVPFLAQLRDDQKNQVRMLATMAGLGPVVTALMGNREVARDDSKSEN